MSNRTTIAIAVVAGVAALVVSVISLILTLTADTSTSRPVFPSSPAEYTKAVVDQAVSKFKSEGREAAIGYYNMRANVDGEWYVFIIEEDGVVIAHPTVPDNIGQSITGPLGTDINGYDFGSEMLAADENGKWVDYVYLNPARGNRQETKHSWVVKHENLLFASGWYEVSLAAHPLLPAKSAPAAYTQAFVEKAIRHYKAEGYDATVAYYNSPESVDSPWYLFMSDESEVLVVNPATPQIIGMVGRDVYGPDGYPIGREVEAAVTEDGAWVDYSYLNPATGEPETKHSWVVLFDGMLFGSGWYEPSAQLEPPTKAQPAGYTKAFVDQAVDRYNSQGLDAALAYHSSPQSVDGQWYVFIVAEDGTTLANANPDLIGMNLNDPIGTDVDGYNFGADMLAVTEAGSWVDYVFDNPATGNRHTKHAWVVRHDDLIFGSGWYDDEPVGRASKANPGAYSQSLVANAIRRYDGAGRAAALDYYNSPESVDGDWYVFIIGRDGRIAAHPTRPERVGLVVAEQVDTNGYDYGADIAGASEEGGWVDYTYFNPIADAVEVKHSWVVRHDGLVFGSGWYEK